MSSLLLALAIVVGADSPTVKTVPAPTSPIPLGLPPMGDSLRAKSKGQPGEARVTVVPGISGGPAVDISDRGIQRETASVQMALILDPKDDPQKLEPLPLDDEEARASWKREIARLHKPVFPGAAQTVETAEARLALSNGELLTIRAHDNSLKKPSAFGLSANGQRLVFYSLDSWTNDKGAFHWQLSDLDIPNRFGESGRLRIWLLDSGKPVWAETVDWPGKTAIKPVQPAPSGPVKPKPALPSPSSETPAVPKPIAPPPQVPPQPSVKPLPPKSAPQQGAPSAQKSPLPPAKPDPTTMSIDELIRYIEQNFGNQMTPAVRKAWAGGMYNYYNVPNPESVKRDVFMTLLRNAYRSQPPGELRDCFAILYQKLKQAP